MVVPVKAWGVVQFGSRKKVSIMKEHEFVILCINEFVQASFIMIKRDLGGQCALVFVLTLN